MEKTRQNPRQDKLFQTGDPNTAFRRRSPKEILRRFGPPRTLLSSSTKSDKCQSVGVLARVLYLTPGLFCPHATAGCRASCLGHSSGRMRLPEQTVCRDRRAALYLDQPKRFVSQIASELYQLQDEAKTLRLRPAARLNGSSDIAWETHHPELFEEFPKMSFFDYTKSRERMERFLSQHHWPANYHLTFSAAPGNHTTCRKFLKEGGTVAVVFRPECPSTFWGYPVVNGDQHDARFLDSSGVIVGLRAKSREADLDRTGFTVKTASRRPQ